LRSYLRRRFKEDIIRAFHDGIKHKPETTFGNVKADTREPVRGRDGRLAGALIRTAAELSGLPTAAAERVADDVFRLTVHIDNRTPLGSDARASRALAQRSTFGGAASERARLAHGVLPRSILASTASIWRTPRWIAMMRWCWWMRRRVARHCLGDRSRAGARYRIHSRSGGVAAWLGPGRGTGTCVGVG
jgi:hypothetical protein